MVIKGTIIVCMTILVWLAAGETWGHSRTMLQPTGRFLYARVSKVVDGDSFEIQVERAQRYGLRLFQPVRLIGINAREMSSRDEPERLFAHWQRDYAFYHLYDKRIKVELEIGADGSCSRDKYGRLLAYFHLPQGILYQEMALSEGWVTGYYRFAFNPKYVELFRLAENQARRRKDGLYDYPPRSLISTEALRGQIGHLVHLTCHVADTVVYASQRLIIAETAEGRRTVAVVPGSYSANFISSPNNHHFDLLPGRTVLILGFVSGHEGEPRIRVYFPSQLQIPAQK